jgi:hypothetical protein
MNREERQRQQPQYNEERNREICDLYQRGWSITDLSDIEAVSQQRIINILKAHGIPLRGRT